eukprot:Gb_18296 [translate_table: standard]
MEKRKEGTSIFGGLNTWKCLIIHMAGFEVVEQSGCKEGTWWVTNENNYVTSPETPTYSSEEDSEEDDATTDMPTSYYYHDEKGEMQPYSVQISKKILQAVEDEEARKYERGHPSFTVSSREFKVSGPITGKEIGSLVEMPLHFAAKKLEVAFGQRQMLSSLIEELCKEDCFGDILNSRAYPQRILSKALNPYALRGSKLFELFLDALQKEMEKSSNLIGEILQIISKQKIDTRDVIQYVFHGTPSANLASILQNGMDPSRRRNHANADFFGMKASISTRYCRQPSKRLEPQVYTLLVFLVLLPGSNYTYDEHLGHLFLTEQQHELPIMTVDVCLT